MGARTHTHTRTNAHQAYYRPKYIGHMTITRYEKYALNVTIVVMQQQQYTSLYC